MSRAREWWVQLARSEPRGRALVYCALVVVTGATTTLLVASRSHVAPVASYLDYSVLTPTERAALLLVGVAGWVLLVALGWTRGTLPVRAIVVAIAITLCAAIVTPSQQSDDVYAYTMYGRILVEHHHNPYSTYPLHFEGDPMRRHVSALWQRTPDIYGIGFTAIMVAFAPIIGESTFLARFLYQLLAAVAVALMLWLLWRRMRSPVALAFVGLHPLLAVSVVNGGHPDALIALGVLAGLLLALDRRPVAAGIAFGLAVSVNFTALVGAAVLAVWAWRRWTRPEVAKFAAVVGMLGALPYLFLSGWFATAHEHSALVSRQSVWGVIGSLLTKSGPLSIASLSSDQFRTVVGNGTTLFAGLLILVVLVRHTKHHTPELALAAGIAVFLVASSWVMPWYAFAALPLLAMHRPNLLTWTVALYSALVLVGDQFPSLSADYVGSFVQQLLQTLVPIAAVVACVVAIVARPHPVRDPAAVGDDDATGAPTLAASA